MKSLTLHGEYWFTDDDTLISVTDGGDYNHEGHVMEHIITAFCEVLGRENTFETDAVWFRTALYDEVNEQADTEIDPLDTAVEKMLARGDDPKMVADMRKLVGGSQMDARAFAITHWGWIRIAGPNVECKNLSADTLKRVHTALCHAYEEDGNYDEIPGNRSVSVSKYHGVCYEIQIKDLEKGKNPRNDRALDILTDAARTQLRKLDIAAQHPCYGNLIGG